MHGQYDPMAVMFQNNCSRHTIPPVGFVSMPKTCDVAPMVFSVFGDLHEFTMN